MGIVECLNAETGRTWVAAFEKGPNMGLVAKDLDEVKEIFKMVSTDNIRIHTSEIPRLESMDTVNPDDYPLLLAKGILKKEGLF